MAFGHFLNSTSTAIADSLVTTTTTTQRIPPISAASLSASQNNFTANPERTNPGASSLGLSAILMLSVGLLGLLLAAPGLLIALRSLSSHRSELGSSRKQSWSWMREK